MVRFNHSEVSLYSLLRPKTLELNQTMISYTSARFPKGRKQVCKRMMERAFKSFAHFLLSAPPGKSVFGMSGKVSPFLWSYIHVRNVFALIPLGSHDANLRSGKV